MYGRRRCAIGASSSQLAVVGEHRVHAERLQVVDRGAKADCLGDRHGAADLGADEIKLVDLQVIHHRDEIIDDAIERPRMITRHRR